MRQKLAAYCDGSCSYKTKIGGYGVYIIDQSGTEYFLKQGYKQTTISRMELMAFLNVIKSVSTQLPIELNVYSDSEYVVKAFSENRLTKWKMIGWEGVANLDLWFDIIDEIEKRPMMILKVNHIKGHQKDLSNPHVFGNNVADILADLHNHKEFKIDKQKKIDLNGRK